MKKIFFFLSAIALLGLTACVEQQPVNPNYNAERGEVKTDFMINIATPVMTKATAEIAQATTANSDGTHTGAFRGMSNMTLFVLKGDPAPASTGSDGGNGTTAPAAADFETTNYNLGTLSGTDISTTKSSKIYNLTFPTDVTNMVFYGVATPKTAENATLATAQANGKITWPTSITNKASAVFGLSPIANITSFEGNANATELLTALNNVVAAFEELDFDPEAVSPISLAYKKLTTIGSTELRLGSAPAVKRMLADLKESMTQASSDPAISADCLSIVDAIATINANNKFPAELGLPEGAAQLTFTKGTNGGNGTFSYVTERGAVDGASATPINKYAFPVELCYWVSSTIRTSSDPDITADMYPTNVDNWTSWTSTATGWAGKWQTPGTITSATRAVALKDNIQYANALLKTTVQYGSDDLKDNNAAKNPGEEDNTVAKTFTVKGILVGKQPAQVGWNFKNESGATYDYVIYDNVFDATAIPTTKPLYTMVFDNYTTSSNANDKVVNIALELVNGDKDFWGKDNLIPAGGTFYLTAKLDLGNQNFDSVFMQDYVTTVTLTIGKDSLKHAYATVPDLRSVTMTFGLSVDLNWQAGASFNVEFGNQD